MILITKWRSFLKRPNRGEPGTKNQEPGTKIENLDWEFLVFCVSPEVLICSWPSGLAHCKPATFHGNDFLSLRRFHRLEGYQPQNGVQLFSRSQSHFFG